MTFSFPSAPPFRSTLVASLLALAMLAPSAQAEIPSVDAYGGEALVLGAPHHRSGGPGSGTGGKSHASPHSGGQAGSPPAVTSSSSGDRTGTTSTGSSVPPTGGPAGAAVNHSGANTHVLQRASGHSSGSTATSSGGGHSAAPAASGSAAPTPSTIAPTAASVSVFGFSDVLLLLAGLLCLTALAATLRLSRKPS